MEFQEIKTNIIYFINRVDRTVDKALGHYASEIMGTFVSLILFSVVYSFITYLIRNQSWSNEKKRRTTVTARNTIFFSFFISLLFLWGGEVKTLIVSTAAIFGAFLIVCKEIVLSFLGSVFVTSNKLFAVGDYIEYDKIQGRIIDKNFLYTRIIVEEPYLSKELIIPNMSFITTRVINLSRLGKFHVYHITVNAPDMQSIKTIADCVIGSAKEAMAEFEEKYNTYFEQRSQGDLFFDKPNITPTIGYNLSDPRKLQITLNYLAHPLDHPKIENYIMEKYIDKVQNINTVNVIQVKEDENAD